MLSIIYKLSDIKIAEDIRFTLFKPNNGTQNILIKGKLGQYKIQLANDKNINKNGLNKTLLNTLKKRDRNGNNKLFLRLYNSSTAFLRRTKNIKKEIEENKMLIITAKNKKIYFACSKKSRMRSMSSPPYSSSLKDIEEAPIPEGEENKSTPNSKAENIYKQNKIFIKNNARNQQKIYLGYLQESEGENTQGFHPAHPSLANERRSSRMMINDKEEKKQKFPKYLHVGDDFIMEQIKNIMIGISQGFSTNLQLRGIGFNGKIISSKKQNVDRDGTYANADLLKNAKTKYQTFVETIYNKSRMRKSLPRMGNDLEEKNAWKMDEKNCRTNNVEEADDYFLRLRRAQSFLILNLGLSHEVVYKIPEDSVTLNIAMGAAQSSSGTNLGNIPTIGVFGISKKKVNQVAANIYKYRKPEPYKGKGIRYNREKIFIKNTDKKNG